MAENFKLLQFIFLITIKQLKSSDEIVSFCDFYKFCHVFKFKHYTYKNL